jgi:hypothetical protein
VDAVPVLGARRTIVKSVSLVTDYEVAAGDVKLSVVVGDAQIGSSIVKLGTKPLAQGEIANLTIGSGPKVKNKPLFVKSVVTDVNDSTNHTSVTYRLTGGRVDQDFLSTATVDENGDSIIYRAKFNLI